MGVCRVDLNISVIFFETFDKFVVQCRDALLILIFKVTKFLITQ